MWWVHSWHRQNDKECTEHTNWKTRCSTSSATAMTTEMNIAHQKNLSAFGAHYGHVSLHPSSSLSIYIYLFLLLFHTYLLTLATRHTINSNEPQTRKKHTKHFRNSTFVDVRNGFYNRYGSVLSGCIQFIGTTSWKRWQWIRLFGALHRLCVIQVVSIIFGWVLNSGNSRAWVNIIIWFRDDDDANIEQHTRTFTIWIDNIAWLWAKLYWIRADFS